MNSNVAEVVAHLRLEEVLTLGVEGLSFGVHHLPDGGWRFGAD